MSICYLFAFNVLCAITDMSSVNLSGKLQQLKFKVCRRLHMSQFNQSGRTISAVCNIQAVNVLAFGLLAPNYCVQAYSCQPISPDIIRGEWRIEKYMLMDFIYGIGLRKLEWA